MFASSDAIGNDERMRGIISIVLAIVFIIGGLTGRLVLIGTHSSGALVVVGAIMLVIGIARLSRGV